ncbi:MAG: 6-phosphofructokinase [Candidatus Gygaella obscura]|nr:6-phosphofructokinase [Candidatus Gygaella obscura]
MKKIAVLTSGGDAPGMNAAIRAVVRFATYNKIDVMGVFRGYEGLIQADLKSLNHRSVSNIINRGGTILKTARSDEFLTEEGQKKAVKVLKENSIDGLVLIGGNGTYKGAIALSKKWDIPCIGIPGTIDNDINGTDSTLGADTAVNTALEAIDKIRDTATSMERIFVIEVMGRDSGYIALTSALGGGAEEVVLPEMKFDFDNMNQEIVEGNIRGKISWIVVVAEGAGKAEDVADKITETTGLEVRVVVLGHVQRGGIPTARDRILATRMGVKAVELLIAGEKSKAVGVISNDINVVDLEFAVIKKAINVESLYRLVKIVT